MSLSRRIGHLEVVVLGKEVKYFLASNHVRAQAILGAVFGLLMISIGGFLHFTYNESIGSLLPIGKFAGQTLVLLGVVVLVGVFVFKRRAFRSLVIDPSEVREEASGRHLVAIGIPNELKIETLPLEDGQAHHTIVSKQPGKPGQELPLMNFNHREDAQAMLDLIRSTIT